MLEKKLQLVCGVVLAVLLFAFVAGAAVIDVVWVGDASDYWNVAANWSGGVVPNNSGTDTYNVSTGSGTVFCNGEFTVDTVNVNGNLSIGSSAQQSLTLVGGTSTVSGQIAFNDAVGYAGGAYLNINSDHTLQGGGAVNFVTSGDNYISGSGVLTVGPDFSVQALAGSKGTIGAGLYNRGTVRATGGIMTITGNAINEGLIRSQAGTLNLAGMSLTNTDGQISVVSGSNFNIVSSLVIGGELVGGGGFNIDGTSTLTGATLAADTAVRLGSSAAETLVVSGGMTNNGTIFLSDLPGYGGAATLSIAGGDVEIGGSGKIVFDTYSPGNNLISASASTPSARLVIGENQELKTSSSVNSGGTVGIDVINNGKISVVGTGTMNLNENVTNNGLIASENGTLNLNTMTLTNTGHQISVVSGSNFNIVSSLVIGGELVGGGVFNVDGTSTLTGATLAADTAVRLGSSEAETLVVSGGMTNNGTIFLSDLPGYGGAATLSIAGGDVEIGGSGKIVFDTYSPGNNLISASASTPSARLVIGENQELKTSSSVNSGGTVGIDVINNGKISVVGTGTMNLNENVTNNGLIASENGTLNLNTMILTNTDHQISVVSGSNFNIVSSLVIGGELVGGGVFNIDGTSTLTGATLAADTAVRLGSSAAETLVVSGGMTNNGTIFLSDLPGYGGAATLSIAGGDVEIGGSGKIVFDTYSPGNNLISASASTPSARLVIGQSQTVRAVSGGYGTISIDTINNGTVAADGGTLNLPASLTNNGLIRSTNGSMLTVNSNIGGTGGWLADGGNITINANVTTAGDVAVDNDKTLTINAGKSMQAGDVILGQTAKITVNGTFNVLDDFSFAMNSESYLVFGTSSKLQMLGGVGSTVGNFGTWGSLEVGGSDKGTDPVNHIGAAAGFTNNFAIAELVIGAGAHVYLADLLDNGNRNGSFGENEALYVNKLTFADGAGVLNLNGLNLYYNTLAGSTDQIIDVAVPEPTMLALLGIGSLVLLKRNKK